MVCSFSTVINDTSIAIIATVLDKDSCVMIKEMEAETGTLLTTVHHILAEHLFKKKCGCMVGTTFIDRCAKTNSSQNRARIFKMVRKWRKFCKTDNCYYGDMDKRFLP